MTWLTLGCLLPEENTYPKILNDQLLDAFTEKFINVQFLLNLLYFLVYLTENYTCRNTHEWVH